jgi:hypothetical protein
MRRGRRPVVLALALLLAAVACAGCGRTTIRGTGTPPEERAKADTAGAIQAFWHGFTGGDGGAVCEVSTRRLIALWRAMGGNCAAGQGQAVLSQGLDLYDARVSGGRVQMLTGAHGPYKAHRIVFTTVREAGRWKVDRFELLPPRTEALRG